MLYRKEKFQRVGTTMKTLYISLLIFAVLLLAEGTVEKTRKHKKYRKHRKPAPTDEPVVAEDDAKAAAFEMGKQDSDESKEANEEIIDNRVPLVDPCIKVHCGAGRVCEVDSEGEPQCVCIPTCPVETESRRKVCSNHNETWTSDCAVYQQRCLCDRGDEQCKGEQYKHVHIEYYGECREMRECTKQEMDDFPRRMRDWLFNIMRDMADRSELTPHYLKMEREAESNMTRRWTNAAIWKFCDLDGYPPDRSVSRHELFPIRAPLMSLEHCIAPFLNGCDANDDHKITIKEWAKCLQLDEDEIDDKCEEILDDE